MPHEVDECNVFRCAVAVLVKIVVVIFSPVRLYVHATVPVLASEGDTLPYMPFKKRHVYDIVGLGEGRGYSSGQLTVVT